MRKGAVPDEKNRLRLFLYDVIHEGHRNILRKAREYGEVIVGLLTDRAMIRYDRFPTISFEERRRLFEELDGISRIVVQDDVLYDTVIAELRPDYVIHGDNWKTGPQAAIRESALRHWKLRRQLIEVPYTYSEEVRLIDKRLRDKLAMPEFRVKRLKQLIGIRPIVKVIEAHDGLTGLIAEKTVVENDGEFDQFDAMWVSSLCDSTAKGKPDIELVDMTSRCRTIDDILEVTTKPIIFDGDTGGQTEHFVYLGAHPRAHGRLRHHHRGQNRPEKEFAVRCAGEADAGFHRTFQQKNCRREKGAADR